MKEKAKKLGYIVALIVVAIIIVVAVTRLVPSTEQTETETGKDTESQSELETSVDDTAFSTEIMTELESIVETESSESTEIVENTETTEEPETTENTEKVEETEITEKPEEPQPPENSETEKEPAEPDVPKYTFEEYSPAKTMYAKSSVNVRDLPEKIGNRVGGLTTNQEVTVLARCKETGWYKIEYMDSVAYVSGNYLVTEKIVVEKPKPEVKPEPEEPEETESEEVVKPKPTPTKPIYTDESQMDSSRLYFGDYVGGNYDCIVYWYVPEEVLIIAVENDWAMSGRFGRIYNGNPLMRIYFDKEAELNNGKFKVYYFYCDGTMAYIEDHDMSDVNGD